MTVTDTVFVGYWRQAATALGWRAHYWVRDDLTACGIRDTPEPLAVNGLPWLCKSADDLNRHVEELRRDDQPCEDWCRRCFRTGRHLR